jgi:hypothetical protein
MSLLKWDATSQAYLDEVAKFKKLAQEYHERCEAYDASVCTATSPRSGLALPVDGKELGLVLKNAREVMLDIAKREGVSEQELRTAISRSGY